MQRQHFDNDLESLSFMSSPDQEQANQESPTTSPLSTLMHQYSFTARPLQSEIKVQCDQPLSNEFEANERAFHAEFAQIVSAFLQDILVRFPYRHVINWSIQVGDRCQHDLNIEIKPPVPMQHNSSHPNAPKNPSDGNLLTKPIRTVFQHEQSNF